MSGDKQNLNRKRREAWEKFCELYHKDTKFELKIFPAGNNQQVLFLSDFLRMKRRKSND